MKTANLPLASFNDYAVIKYHCDGTSWTKTSTSWKPVMTTSGAYSGCVFPGKLKKLYAIPQDTGEEVVVEATITYLMNTVTTNGYERNLDLGLLLLNYEDDLYRPKYSSNIHFNIPASSTSLTTRLRVLQYLSAVSEQNYNCGSYKWIQGTGQHTDGSYTDFLYDLGRTNVLTVEQLRFGFLISKEGSTFVYKPYIFKGTDLISYPMAMIRASQAVSHYGLMFVAYNSNTAAVIIPIDIYDYEVR